MKKSTSTYLPIALLFVLGLMANSIGAQDGDNGDPAQAAPSNRTVDTGSIVQVKSNKQSKKALKGPECPVECVCSDIKVNCENKKLTAIPNLTKFTTVTNIDLSNNSITSLEFSLLPLASLEKLDLSHNMIKTIVNISKKGDASVPKLKTLDLSANKIETLANFSAWKLPALEVLNLSQNPIEDIGNLSFNNAKNLQALDISQTSLKSVHESAFLPLSQLRNLTMKGVKLTNHLGGRQFVNNQKLEVVDLTDNGLSEVPVALRSTSGITTLILNNNFMTSLRQSDFINRTGLVNLEIRLCPKLTKVDESTFSDLHDLRVLIISQNPSFNWISKDAFKSEKNHTLDMLDLRDNNITTLFDPKEFSSLTEVKQIRLKDNPWNCNCELKWLLSLSTIHNSLFHCKTPEQFRDIEISQYFLTTDCEAEESGYHNLIVTAFLLFLFGLFLAVIVQKSDICRRLRTDQYGTIYYTKASFPPETA